MQKKLKSFFQILDTTRHSHKMVRTLFNFNLLCLPNPRIQNTEAPLDLRHSINVEFYMLWLELEYFKRWWEPTGEPLPEKWYKVSENVEACRLAWFHERHLETEREKRESEVGHRTRIERLGRRIKRLKERYVYKGDDPSPRYTAAPGYTPPEEVLPPYREAE